MPSEDHAVQLARQAFATEHGVDPGEISVVSISKEQIPNPPLKPGEVSIGLVRYRYFVQLRARQIAQRFRVEGANVYRA